MFHSIKEKFKKLFQFKWSESIIALLFLVALFGIFSGSNLLPSAKINFVSNYIALEAESSKTNSVSISFSSSKGYYENSFLSQTIQTFNSFNNSSLKDSSYKKMVCTNVLDKSFSLSNFKNKNPAILMTSWSSSYYDEQEKVNIFMSDIAILGIAKSRPVGYNFCYITQDQADYLIAENPNYHEYSDLFHAPIKIQTNNNKFEAQELYIQDIILGNYGCDSRYKDLFGSYIISYYVPFAKMNFSFLYDLGTDVNQNASILKDFKKDNSNSIFDRIDIYSLDNSVNKSSISKSIIDYLSYSSSTRDFIIYGIILLVSIVALTFISFLYCEKYKHCSNSLILIFVGVFVVLYELLRLMVRLKIPFFVSSFSATAVYAALLLLAVLIIAILISKFCDEKEQKNIFNFKSKRLEK